MSLSSRRLRSIGWLALLAVCATLVMVLTMRVNALRSQVRREENRVVALREETMYLQTEFETRASQQQLKAWNDVDFGYVAPSAGQYLENERQLAMLGKPAAPDAPAPVRLAELGDSATGLDTGSGGTTAVAYSGQSFPAMVSPLTGKPYGAAGGRAVRSDAVMRTAESERLLASDHGAAAGDAADGSGPADHAAATAALGDRLGHLDHAGPGKATPKPRAKAKPATKPKAATKGAGKTASATSAKAKSAKPHAKSAATPRNGHRPDHRPAAHKSEKPA